MEFIYSLDWTSISTGILASIVAAILFLFAMFMVRPNIRISRYVAQDVHPDTGVPVYVFKLVNKSLFFKVYEVQVKLRIVKLKSSANSTDRVRTDGDAKLINGKHLIINTLFFKHIFQKWTKDKKLNSRTDYAIQFGTYYDLQKVISENKTIIIMVIAKHALSGFSKVVSREYSHSSDIKSGEFRSGNSFDIIVANQ